MEALDGHETFCQSPVFVLTTSRSGSTLVRFILDSHPELACPPETGLTNAFVNLVRTWSILDNAGREGTLVNQSPAIPAAVLAITRDPIDRIYDRYLRSRSKRRWCDKSLDSFEHAELVLELYPDARFICLYRHCMDVIDSGVEACPWGVSRFGFDPYVAQNPGNSVAAIGSYWNATTQAILEFEDKHPQSCCRIRYEDLVSDPEQTAAAMFSFIGVEHMPGITEMCFQTPHEANGPGDEKIWFTSEVTAGAIGRGVRVPPGALPPPLLEGINATLARLDYRLVDDAWTAAAGQVDPRLQPAVATVPANGSAGRSAELAEMASAIEARIRTQQSQALCHAPARWPALTGHTVTLVVEGSGGLREEVRWTFMAEVADDLPPSQNGHGAPVLTMFASAATWRALLDREVNMVTEMTAGRLRCVNRRDAHRIRSDEVHAIAWLLGLTRIPVEQIPG